MSTAISLTHLAQRFLQPRNSTQRVYEALRAFCVDRIPAREVAQRFGYTPAEYVEDLAWTGRVPKQRSIGDTSLACPGK